MTSSLVPTSTRGRDLLLRIAYPLRDAEGLITVFVANEALRCGGGRFDDTLAGSLAQRLDVLFWYLGPYARAFPDRAVPLSDSQIAFLNQPALIAGNSPAVTVALHNFVLLERMALADLRQPGNLAEALYWWCVEKVPQERLDERLVTQAQVDALRLLESGGDQAFALTGFTRRFHERHAELYELDVTVARDRAALLVFLIAQGFTNPSLLRLLPRDDTRKILAPTANGPSVFDEVLARYAVSGGMEDARALRAMGEALIARAGHPSLKSLFSMRGPEGKRRPEPLAARPPAAGVALIGPIGKSSGLGQAARLSADILATCERIAPAVLDFDIENPSPTGFDPVGESPRLDEPRSITLLQLNADILPLAFAHCQDRLPPATYTIGYVFWELNEIPPCHTLALDLVDEVWVASDYCRQIYQQRTDKPVVTVGMAAAPVGDGAPMPRDEIGITDDAFVFLATFDSFSFVERKNPLAAVKAFQQAFPPGIEDVRLVLKTQNRRRVDDPYQVALWSRIDRATVDPRIIVIDETFHRDEFVAFQRAFDCYVSLHRAEGFGFGLLEAMQLGLPVIATDYSGTREFCTHDTAFLVDYTLVPVQRDEYLYAPRGSLWAEPDTASAAAHMRTVRDAPEMARRKADAARRLVADRFSVAAIGERYATRLAAIRERRAEPER